MKRRNASPTPRENLLSAPITIQATTYLMQTFHEFLAKKAMVLPNLFRIEPFIGLAQPIRLKPIIKRTVKPRSRLGGVKKGSSH